jgi:hypothetical protein
MKLSMRAIFTGVSFVTTLSGGQCRAAGEPDQGCALRPRRPANGGIQDADVGDGGIAESLFRVPATPIVEAQPLWNGRRWPTLSPVDAAWFGLLFPQLLVERRACTPHIS